MQVTHFVFTLHMLMVQSSPPAVKMYFPSCEQAISVTLVEGERGEESNTQLSHTSGTLLTSPGWAVRHMELCGLPS